MNDAKAASPFDAYVAANRDYVAAHARLTTEFQEALGRQDLGGAFALAKELRRLTTSFYSEWEKTMALLARAAGTSPEEADHLKRERQLAALWLVATLGAQLDGRWPESEECLREGLALAGTQPGEERAKFAWSLGQGLLNRSEYAEALPSLRVAAGDFAVLQNWLMRVRTRVSISDCLRGRGDLKDALAELGGAIQEAKDRGLGAEAARFGLKKLSQEMMMDAGGSTRDRIRDAVSALKKERPEDTAFEVELLQTSAQLFEVIGEDDDARDDLDEALARAGDNVSLRWTTLQQIARFEQNRRRIAIAIRRASKALNLARQSEVAAYVTQSLQSLLNLRWERNEPSDVEQAKQELAELQQKADSETYFNALIGRGVIEMNANRFEAALATFDECAGLATHDGQCHLIQFGRTAALVGAKRLNDALESVEKALSLLPDDDSSHGSRAKLHLVAAEIEAGLGRPRESLRRAEWGRGYGFGVSEPPRYEDLQDWLDREGAAAAFVCLSKRGTFVAVAEPHREPWTKFVVLKEGDIEKSTRRPNPSAKNWNPSIERGARDLLPRLAPALEDVARRNRLLYLAADAGFAAFPFATLRFSDGSVMADHCATVLTPSLRAARMLGGDRDRPDEKRSLLAASAGEEQGVSLTPQAHEIASFPCWRKTQVIEEASVDAFLDALGNAEVVHLVCHGMVTGSVEDGMAASILRLAGEKDLTAKKVAAQRIAAELVFLNACTSAVYRSDLASELSGFPLAFLQSGAKSIIGTLTYVNPKAAQRLAAAFYEEWARESVSKAEALRRAQVRLKEQGAGILDWASHVLIGAH